MNSNKNITFILLSFLLFVITLAAHADSVIYSYDPTGQLVTIANTTVANGYSYDDVGNLDEIVSDTPTVDLTVTVVNGPSAANTESVISGTVRYKNLGLGNVPESTSFKVGFYLSTDTTITTGDTFVAMTESNGIGGWQEKAWYYSVTVPTGMSTGTYYLGAIVDYEDAVDNETSETNNALAGNSIYITKVYPDLIVTFVNGPVAAETESNITGTVKYKNQGLGSVPAATSFGVGLYLSTDSTITTGDTYVGATNTTGMGIGEEKTWNYDLTVPAGVSSGTYYLGAIADHLDAVDYESNETNNSLAGDTIVINPPVIGVSPSPYNYGSVTGGESGVKTFTVSNSGSLDLILGSLAINGVDAEDYALDEEEDNCSGQTLESTEDCTFDAAFSPSAAGLRYGTVKIPSNDPVTPLYSLSLTGTGASTPNIKARSVLVDEGFTNGISWDWTVDDDWYDSNPCSRSGIPFTSPWAIADSDCKTTTVEDLITPVLDASSCTVDLEFNSLFDQYGSSTASVRVSDDAGENWTQVEQMTADEGPGMKVLGGIQGTDETQLMFRLTSSETDGYWVVDDVWTLCSPARLKLAGLINSASPPQIVEVANRGFADLTIGTVSITGTDSSYFDIDYDDCSSEELPSSSTCQIDVVFTATDFTARSATLEIPSDDPDTSTLNVPLSGAVANTLDGATYLEGLQSVTTGDGSASNTTDLLAYLSNGVLNEGTNYPIEKDKGKYKVLSVETDRDAQYMSELHLYVYSHEDSGDINVYAYQSDGVSIDTSDDISFTIATGWNDIDVTSLAELMDGYGFVKFRITPDGSSISIQEVKLAPEY